MNSDTVKIKLIYPHHIGDRVELFGALFDRDGEYHYATVNIELANQIVAQGGGIIVEEINNGQ